MWKIHLLYAGLVKPLPGKVHATENDWQALLAELQQWVNQKPKSVTAHIALASAYMDYAWLARGSGYADTVSSSGWNQFDSRVAKANQLLDDADALVSKTGLPQHSSASRRRELGGPCVHAQKDAET